MRATLLAIALLAALWVAAASAYRPGPARGAGAPAAEFSAARAIAQLNPLLAESVPHPMGSAANAVVRERIVSRLRVLGYEPELQTGFFECDIYSVCGTPVNIVARLGGRDDGAASVLLAAHYDSVAAGPGASDDGAGVAEILEIARILKRGPPPSHPIILLWTDGEEVGLLGAQVFVRHHRWAGSIRAAVNVDNRGTSGPALMFETGSANAWSIGLYSHAVRHPLTNSLYYAVYERLPNNTDFTVFKAAGYQGFNFAFIGNVGQYHTPLDDLAHLHARSIQQQGDAALATLLALADGDIDRPPAGDAVYFDLFGESILRFPEAAVLPVAVATLLLGVATTVLLARRSRDFSAEVAWSAGALLLGWIAVAALAHCLLWILDSVTTTGLPDDSASAWAPLMTFGALGALGIGALGLGLRRRAHFWSFWCANLLLIGVLATVSAAALPGASYLFLLPAVAALAATTAPLRGAPHGGAAGEIAALGCLAVTFALLWPVLLPLYAGLGSAACPLLSSLIVVGGAPLTGLLLRADRRVGRWIATAAILTLCAGVACTLALPAYTPEFPQPLDIRYLLESPAAGSPPPQWLVQARGRAPPRAMLELAHFAAAQPQTYNPLLDFGSGAAFAAAATPMDLPPPRASLLSATPSRNAAPPQRVRYRIRIASPRAAQMLAIAFPPDASIQSVDVTPADDPRRVPVAVMPRIAGRRWRVVRFVRPPAAGIDLEFDASRASFDIDLMDVSAGLPVGGGALQEARPSNMVPIQGGDVTLATATVNTSTWQPH